MTADGRLDTLPGYWVWRDDLYERGGSRGGKVRTCWALAQQGGPLVTAGSRHSPQVNIVAGIASHLGVPCRVHVPAGAPTPEVTAAGRSGAEVVRHRPGYNSVIVKRAKEDADRLGWVLVPFGMEHEEAVRQNRAAAEHVARLVRPTRLVVPVGSGMTLAGLLHGLPDDWPVLGVQVGADPRKRLERWAPPNWRDRVALVKHPAPYDHAVRLQLPDGTPLDPHYEAKCGEYMRRGDLLWVVGLRGTLEAEGGDVHAERRVPAAAS